MERRICGADCDKWVGFAAAGGLVAGGLLLLLGNKKAGLATAAASTALALLDQQDTVKECWNALPGYIDHAQRALGKVERTVDEVAQQRERLHQILTS
jgi:hypothetical protein